MAHCSDSPQPATTGVIVGLTVSPAPSYRFGCPTSVTRRRLTVGRPSNGRGSWGGPGSGGGTLFTGRRALRRDGLLLCERFHGRRHFGLLLLDRPATLRRGRTRRQLRGDPARAFGREQRFDALGEQPPRNRRPGVRSGGGLEQTLLGL